MAMNPLPLLALGAVALLLMSKDTDDDDAKEDFVPPNGNNGNGNGNGNGGDTGDTGDTGSGVKYGGTSSNPPNLSGDSEGYNTTMFPTPLSVRTPMRATLGYNIAINTNPLVDNPMVESFQRHYNWVSLNPNESIGGPFTASDLGTKGTLLVDGIAGKYTLRAVEAALLKGSLWSEYISSAEAGYPGGGVDEAGDYGPVTCVKMSIGGDHDRDSHDELTDVSKNALKLALVAIASGQSLPGSGILELHLMGGLRGADEGGQTLGDFVQHAHTIELDESEIKAMTRGENVTLESGNNDDDDSRHTHTITFRKC